MPIQLNTIILSSNDTYFNNDNGIDFIDPTFNPDWVNLKSWFAGNGPMPQKSGSVITNTIREYPKIKDVFDSTEITYVSDVSAQFKIKTRDNIDLYWNIIKNEDENDLEFDVEMKKFNRSEISGNERIENIDIEKTIDIPNNLTGKKDYKLKLVALDLSGNFKKSKSLNFKTLETGLIFEDLDKLASVKIITTDDGKKYLLNNKTTYDTKARYKLGKGIYTLKDVPIGHPVAIISDSPHISYYGSEENRVTNAINEAIDGYFYYHGDVRIIVKGDFKTASLHCGYHGYMGAENILHYDKNKSGEQVFKSNKIEELPEDNLDLEQIYFGLENSFEIELPESATLSQESQISLSRNINENILLSTHGQEEKMPKILLKELSGNEVLREIEAKNIRKDEMNSRKYKGDISFNIKSDQKLEDISKNEYEFDVIFDESNNIIQKKKTYKIKTKVKRPKILCLHGGGQSVDNFKNQEGIKDLSNNLGREFEFIFADSRNRTGVSDASDVWWKDPDSKGEPTTDISHADASIKYLDDKINEEKPVYGILGYSQGAAMATTYLASKNEEGEERSKKFEKAFLYNGYLPSTHLGLMEKINDSSLNIPTMIYLSEQDEVIAPELTMRMKNKFRRHKEISTNRGGHRLPRRKDENNENNENDENFNETLDFIRRRKEKDEDILVENIETEIPVIEEFEYSEPTDSSLNIYVQLNVNGKVRLSLRQETYDKERKTVEKNKIQFKDKDDNNNVKDIKVGFHDKGYNEKDKDWSEEEKPNIKKHYQTYHKEVSAGELVTFDISGLQPDEKYIVECHAKGENGYVSRPRRIMFETKSEITDNPEQPDDGEVKVIYVKLRDGINHQTPNYIEFREGTEGSWSNEHDKPDWAIKGKKYKFIVADSLASHPMQFYRGHDFTQVIIGSDIASVGASFIIQTSPDQDKIYYRCKFHDAMEGTIILDDEVSIQPVPVPPPNPGPKPILEHVHIGLDETGEFKFYRDFRFMIKNNNKEKDKFLDWPLINERYPILFKNRAYKFINYTNKPFYISENENPDISNVNIIGDGSFNDGITGNKDSNKINAESFILTFKASFDINEDRLFYYDTDDGGDLNNNTLKEFEILPSKERTMPIPSLAPVLSNNKVTFNILSNFRDSNDIQKSNIISDLERSNLEEIKNKSMVILQKYIIDYPKSYDIQLAWGDFTGETAQSIMGYAIPSENRIVLNKAKIAEESTLNGETVKTLTVTLIHEILHIFGLIGIDIDETTTTQDVTINNRKYVWKFYVADKGINQYKNLLNNLKQLDSNDFNYSITNTSITNLEINTIDNLKYILLEDDFGEGTVHVHLEEGINYDYTLEQKKTLQGGEPIHYPSIMNEITTGFQNEITYLTRITLGMLEDLNFKINYLELDKEERIADYFNNIIVV